MRALGFDKSRSLPVPFGRDVQSFTQDRLTPMKMGQVHAGSELAHRSIHSNLWVIPATEKMGTSRTSLLNGRDNCASLVADLKGATRSSAIRQIKKPDLPVRDPLATGSVLADPNGRVLAKSRAADGFKPASPDQEPTGASADRGIGRQGRRTGKGQDSR